MGDDLVKELISGRPDDRTEVRGGLDAMMKLGEGGPLRGDGGDGALHEEDRAHASGRRKTMSRSGYKYDCDARELALWRASVTRAICGKRGQAFLREMLAALDALPEKKLVHGKIVSDKGECCAMGAVALARKLDVSSVDETERDDVADVFGIAPALAAEIAFQNDEGSSFSWGGAEPEANRFARIRRWVVSQIVAPPTTTSQGKE